MQASETQSQASGQKEDHAYWLKHCELHQASGLTRAEYCRANNVNYDRFGYWSNKFSSQTSVEIPSGFVAVKLKTSAKPLSLTTLCTLRFNNDCSLQIHDTSILSLILEKLS